MRAGTEALRRHRLATRAVEKNGGRGWSFGDDYNWQSKSCGIGRARLGCRPTRERAHTYTVIAALRSIKDVDDVDVIVGGGQPLAYLLSVVSIGKGTDLHPIAQRRADVPSAGRFADERDAHARRARTEHPDHPGRSMREIDHASLHERPAVGDRHLDREAILEIRDHHAAAQRKRDRSGRHILLIIDSAGRIFVTVETRAVPRGHADNLRRLS